MRSADGFRERRMGERSATDQARNKVAGCSSAPHPTKGDAGLAVRKNGDGFEVVGAWELVDGGGGGEKISGAAERKGFAIECIAWI